MIRRLYILIRYNPLLTFFLGVVLAWALEETAQQFIDTRGLFGLFLAVAGAVALILLIQAIISAIRHLRAEPRPSMGEPPGTRRGLILLYSNADTARKAIDHHRSRLDYIWFIVTEQSSSRLEALFPHLSTFVTAREWVHDPFQPRETQNAVERATSHAANFGLKSDNLICDITGGTTAMTVGALQACQSTGIALQMVTARYDPELKGPVPLDLIRIELGQGMEEGG